MTSTHRTTIATRITQCLAVAVLIAGLTIGLAATAGAERKWDPAAYEKCLADLGPVPESKPADDNVWVCCYLAGGLLLRRPNLPDQCVGPPTTENVPGESAPTEPPPVLDPGQTGPSNPLIPTPRGPNSGTLAP